MPKLYAKCPFLFIFVRFMQYFSSILHNILRIERCFLCLLAGSKTETLPKHYQFSQKIGYPRHIETLVFTRGKQVFAFQSAQNFCRNFQQFFLYLGQLYKMYTPLFIAFRGVCCSISQREYQRREKIALKPFILKNRVKLNYEFGSFKLRHYFFSKVFGR